MLLLYSICFTTVNSCQFTQICQCRWHFNSLSFHQSIMSVNNVIMFLIYLFILSYSVLFLTIYLTVYVAALCEMIILPSLLGGSRNECDFFCIYIYLVATAINGVWPTPWHGVYVSHNLTEPVKCFICHELGITTISIMFGPSCLGCHFIQRFLDKEIMMHLLGALDICQKFFFNYPFGDIFYQEIFWLFPNNPKEVFYSTFYLTQIYQLFPDTVLRILTSRIFAGQAVWCKLETVRLSALRRQKS